MSKRAFIRSTSVIGIATAASRVLGFVRDIVLANFFGTSIGAQAYVVAFRIPNSLRDLVGEGAMNSAIVPVLTEYNSLGKDEEFKRIARILFNISLVALSVLTFLGILFSPFIIRLIAPGFLDDPEKFNLTVAMSRAMFPYLILIGLTAYSMGVLNSLKHFAAPAFGPALLNIAMIIAQLALCPIIGVYGLAAGVIIGGILQLFLNTSVLGHFGIRFDIKAGFSHAAVSRIGRLLIPRVIGTAVYQINIFVDTILASLSSVVGAGGVAALYYSNRLVQFPLAIFGLAIAQAALPKMSEEFATSDIERFKDTISFSLRAVFLIMVPSAVGLAMLGAPIIRLLFQHGEFSAYSTMITTNALFYYSFGLLSFACVKILVTSFYAMHDTRTPVKTAAAAVAINIILSLLLMWPLKIGGLALATSLSVTCNLVQLYVRLRNRIGDFGTSGILNALGRVLLASLCMAIVLKTVAVFLASSDVALIIVSIPAGILSFILASYIFGIQEMKESWAWISRRR